MKLPTLLVLFCTRWVGSAAYQDDLFQECVPTQVHLTVGKDPSTSMMVSFSSSSLPLCKDAKAFVLLGTNASSLNKIVAEQKPPNQYNYTSPLTDTFYSSAMIHHILVEGLKPETRYFYSCVLSVKGQNPEDSFSTDATSSSQISKVSRFLGGETVESSNKKQLRKKPSKRVIRGKISSFLTAPAPGHGLGRLKFAFVGDLGLKQASNATVHHMSRDHEINSILLVGDVSYANTVQTKWDSWFEMMEHLIMRIPLQTAPGNHEIEIDGRTREIYVPFDNRFSMPQVRNVEKGPTFHASYNSGHDLPYDYGNAYYAYTYGAARFIILCSFTSTAHDSKQYYWLKKELQSIDRTVTPWVFVSFHVPLYNTFGSHNPSKTGQEMKDNLEHLFVYYRVNLVFSGHVHAYMRSKNVAYNKVNQTAPQYIIIGDGGFGNGSSFEKNPMEDWVAKRDGETHGFGTIELLNRTHAHWRWVRNVNENYTNVHDHAFVKNQFFL